MPAPAVLLLKPEFELGCRRGMMKGRRDHRVAAAILSLEGVSIFLNTSRRGESVCRCRVTAVPYRGLRSQDRSLRASMTGMTSGVPA